MKKSFTVIKLVMILTIIGTVAAIALPKIYKIIENESMSKPMTICEKRCRNCFFTDAQASCYNECERNQILKELIKDGKSVEGVLLN